MIFLLEIRTIISEVIRLVAIVANLMINFSVLGTKDFEVRASTKESLVTLG